MNQSLAESPHRHPGSGDGGSDQARSDATNPATTARVLSFAGLNCSLVACFAALHPFSQSPELVTQSGYRSYVGLVSLESLLLFLPAILVAVVLLPSAPRFGKVLSVTVAMLFSAAYFVDLLVYLTIHEHVFSSVTLGIVSSLLPSLWWYVSLKVVAGFIAVVGGWLFVQWVLWKVSGPLAEITLAKFPLSGREFAVAGFGLVVIAVFFAMPAFKSSTTTLSEIQRFADRHPVTAMGWFPANDTPEYRPESIESLLGAALLVHRAETIDKIRSRHSAIRANVDEGSRPATSMRHADVVIVIAECLRPEVMDAKTMPNIFRRSRNGLRTTHHFSAGNSSNYGFFGLMTGLDGCWFPFARQMPVGLISVMQQSGYEVGFFGREGFDQFQMDTFCGPERFDVTEFVRIDDVVECDLEACRRAQRFLDRTDAERASEANPRLAFVYLYATHHDYYSAADDRIHDREDLLRFVPSVRQRNPRSSMHYLNAAHFVDRAVAPLLDDDRLTFVVGDHGESFGEDDRLTHATAMSRTQLQVACVGFGPGLPSKKIDLATSHVDLMATITDALGIDIRESHPRPGRSMIDEIPPSQIIAANSFTRGTVFIRRDHFAKSPEPQSFGYQGFIDLEKMILSPGGWIDRNGNGVNKDQAGSGSWDEAGWMLSWLRQQLGPEFAEIPVDPVPLIRQSFGSKQSRHRLIAVRLASRLGTRSAEVLEDLERLLSDPDPGVREAAFGVIHRIHQ